MRPTAVSRSRLNITSAALCAIGIAPILLMLYIVVTNWLPLPYWDEWTTPGETFTAWCERTLSWRHLFCGAARFPPRPRVGGAILCFFAVQLKNFLWGVQVEVFFPGLALLVMATVNLSGISFPRKALLNGALAFIATYTIAHGMLL